MATIWAIGFPFGSINKPSPCRPSITCQRILRILYCLFSKISAGLLRVSWSSKSSVLCGESIIPKIFFKVCFFCSKTFGSNESLFALLRNFSFRKVWFSNVFRSNQVPIPETILVPKSPASKSVVLGKNF